MKQEYVQFFELLPKPAQLTLRMFVPNRYGKIDTELLACICVQQGLIKKIVIDSLTKSIDKIVNNKLKQINDKRELLELCDLDITDECEILINDYLYFINAYSDKINSDVITTYITYAMVTDDRLNCFNLLNNCFYVKDKESVKGQLFQTLNSVIGNILSDKITQFGEYLTNPLIPKSYTCIGREYEIQKTIDVLCRMNKSNPLLVGQPGVGKTSIVYGVCNVINSKDCPSALSGCVVYSLNTNKLISGTTYRGDLEKRLEDVVNELRNHKKIILFIDEIHTLFDSSSGENSTSTMQSVLKPYLAESSRVIGCTTDSEYKIIESDKAFERRVCTIYVKEITEEQTVETLRSVKNKYENYHNISISDEICNYIVKQCSLYVKNRYFPDKAIDVLDYASVLSSKSNNHQLEIRYVDEAIEKIYNIDINKNANNIYDISNKIKQDIIGQDKAVDEMCLALHKYFLGVCDKTKPIGCYLFVGPTGVGKTELCKQIAQNFFTKEGFIRFDMSEFMEPHSVSKLIGSPPGYVGFSRGGSLTELVKHNPFSVILFDEIEKAHKDVINILLQIMDDGRLTDSFGSTVDFCNTLIIMTSNIGCKDYLDKSKLGFNSNNEQVLEDSVKNFFTPEFRNRLSDIIYFNAMTEDMFNAIFKNKITEYINKWKDNCNIKIILSESVVNDLKTLCNSKKDGVRFISKTLEKHLDNIVIKAVLEGRYNLEITTIHVRSN